MVICHSKTLESSTRPAEKPSMGFRLSSGDGKRGVGGTGRRERKRACRMKRARVGRGLRRGSTRSQAREAGSGERNCVASACSSRVRRVTYP